MEPLKTPALVFFSLESHRHRLHHHQHHHHHQTSNHRPTTAPPPLPDRGRGICPGLHQGSMEEVEGRDEEWAGGKCLKTQR